MNESRLLLALVAAMSSPAAADEVAEIEEVVVQASRMNLAVQEIPVNTTVLEQSDIVEMAWKPADEILRQVPGFSLLRSADSIAAAPTTTTVSLRGLGGSAASRTLVLLDGIPIHGAFTTEVYWARVPRQRIERIEVVRGGGANAWGNLSLGGVVNIVTERPELSGWAFDGTLGYPGTLDLAVSAQHAGDDWHLDGSASMYTTDGYFNLPEAQRGPIDEEVRKDHGMVSLRGDWSPSAGLRAWANVTTFREKRFGGSALDVNETEIDTLVAGFDWETAHAGRWKAQAFYEDFFLSDASVRILGDNEREILRAFEERPTSMLGTGLVGSLPAWGRHEVSVGADYRWSDVRVDEWTDYVGGQPRELLNTISRQDMGGVFVQDHWRFGARWALDGTLRYDYVVNSGKSRATLLEGGEPGIVVDYPANSETTLNGNLGTVFRASDTLSLRASAYRGFRAPTLRELYHVASTRSGVILVNNPGLQPERLVGIEAGADLALGPAATLRLTVFRNTVDDLVQNITRGTTGELPGIVPPCGLLAPNETCRELDNVGEMRSSGLELEAAWQPSDHWELQLSYLFNESKITEAPDNPQLVGNRVRQAPRHSLSARLRHAGRWFDSALMARYVGKRYEDDLNRLEVDDFVLFDLRLARAIGPNAKWFLAVENLFDEEYEVKVENSGALEIGRPRFVGVGLQIRR
ncbi:MAG: TonB-dependent receptor [Gammaproteobacteria bacterium]|nr:TonB-dependent receptor [Gammaproteobacteria bacterium]